MFLGIPFPKAQFSYLYNGYRVHKNGYELPATVLSMAPSSGSLLFLMQRYSISLMSLSLGHGPQPSGPSCPDPAWVPVGLLLPLLTIPGQRSQSCGGSSMTPGIMRCSFWSALFSSAAMQGLPPLSQVSWNSPRIAAPGCLSLPPPCSTHPAAQLGKSQGHTGAGVLQGFLIEGGCFNDPERMSELQTP